MLVTPCKNRENQREVQDLTALRAVEQARPSPVNRQEHNSRARNGCRFCKAFGRIALDVYPGNAIFSRVERKTDVTRKENTAIRRRAGAMLRRAGIVLTKEEERTIEVVDFGLNDIATIGLEIVVYENNDQYCAKELVMFPRQTCPEHRHPPLNPRNNGKKETFRVRRGTVYLYTEGAPTARPRARIPDRYRRFMTVWHEHRLKPGEQYTIPADTLHWFQAGDEGAIVSEFSSTSDDASDVFTDPAIQRLPNAR
jgi:D-lyxose ketol-isomerase